MYLKSRFRFSRNEIAQFLGLSKRQVMTRLHKYRLYAAEGLIPSVELKSVGLQIEVDETPQAEVVLDEIEKQNRSIATRIANDLIRKDVLEERLVKACAPKLPSPADLKAVEKLYHSAKVARSKPKTAHEVAVATMSDLHLGLDTPQHPYKKALEANDNYIRRVLRLVELQRKNFSVKTIHLNLLGDLIQGSSSNYEMQRWDTTLPAVNQIERATEVYVKNIQTLLIDFDDVVVNCSPGNHGRIAPNPVEPGNWETIMHRSLRWAFRDNKRIKFNIEDEDFYQVIDINGSKFLLMHGHALKGGNFDGLVMSFRKYDGVLPDYRYAIIGHFHRFARLPLPKVIGSKDERTLFLNGTAVERDDHIEKMGGSPTSLWWLHFVGNRGITNGYDVRLYD